MKIRNGFVSNSSSSSFCIYGICTEEDKIKEALISKGFATEEELDDGISEYLEIWGYESRKQKGTLTPEDIQNNERKFFKAEENFVGRSPGESDYVYLGVPWHLIRDDETGKQFKERIENKLKQLFENVKCSTHSEAWYNG